MMTVIIKRMLHSECPDKYYTQATTTRPEKASPTSKQEYFGEGVDLRGGGGQSSGRLKPSTQQK